MKSPINIILILQYFKYICVRIFISCEEINNMKAKQIMEQNELMKQEKAFVNRIYSNEHFAYSYFHEKCSLLFSSTLWKIFKNKSDYDKISVNFHLQLKKSDSHGIVCRSLKMYNNKTVLFNRIKTAAVRDFSTPSHEVFTFPTPLIASQIIEEMLSNLHEAAHRKFMWFKYIKRLDDENISDEMFLERFQLTVLLHTVIKQLKSVIENHHPEYFNIIFLQYDVVEVRIEEVQEPLSENTANKHQEGQIDIYKYLDSIPNKRYRYCIKSLFLDDRNPKDLAKEMNTSVSNIYNIKSRGLNQLSDITIYPNEANNFKKYIDLISGDRKRKNSILSYVDVCSDLEITEVLFKRTIKEIKNKIFKAKS